MPGTWLHNAGSNGTKRYEPLREVAARFSLGEVGVRRETSTFSCKDEFSREIRPCDQGMIIYVKLNNPFSGHNINDRNG